MFINSGRIEHQWWWPHWWKLWPQYSETYDSDFDIFSWYYSFGPYQSRGYRSNKKEN